MQRVGGCSGRGGGAGVVARHVGGGVRGAAVILRVLALAEGRVWRVVLKREGPGGGKNGRKVM